MEDERNVRRDADPKHSGCEGRGWHWGWDFATRDPVRLRCPCVDQKRALRQVEKEGAAKYLAVTRGAEGNAPRPIPIKGAETYRE